MKETKHSLAQIEELLRGGHGAQAAEHLKAIKPGDLSAEERVRYASLARRLSLPELSLRLLNPIVRPQGRMISEATDGEKIEYAASLIKIRALSEALEILKTIPTESHPDALLFQSFAHIVQWNYGEAVPLLQAYVRAPSLSPYQRLVGQANLCEALVHNQSAGAGEMIEKTLKEAKEQSFTLIHGYVQLTKIDLMIAEKKWNEAERVFREAEAAFSKSNTLETFFVKKWGAILELQRNGSSPQALKRISEIREEAISKWNHWDTARECDFYRATATRELSLLQYVYFGSPFESYRQRLNIAPPEFYRWSITGEAKPTVTLELFSGDSSLRKALLKTGNLRYRLLSVLTKDFYRPARLAELAAQIYPGEYFNPTSTPVRVRLAIHRLRHWLKSEKIPLVVEEVKGAYRLSSTRPVQLVLPSHSVFSGSPELNVLRHSFADREWFSANEVSKVLAISMRSVNRLLKEGESSHLLVRSGKGRATRYRWTVSEGKLAA